MIAGKGMQMLLASMGIDAAKITEVATSVMTTVKAFDDRLARVENLLTSVHAQNALIIEFAQHAQDARTTIMKGLHYGGSNGNGLDNGDGGGSGSGERGSIGADSGERG